MDSVVHGRDAKLQGWPSVAVVMPIRNEAANLEAAVASIVAQTYPESVAVCLAVGPSDDDTLAVARTLATSHPQVQVVENPAGRTAAGLNAAIAATSSDVVVRVDGHAKLSAGYIQRAVETMMQTGAVNVGGVQAAVGETRFERAVADAQRSPVGTGGGRFHVGGEPGPVDTVYLGVFDRAAGDAVGWFDESLVRNQDYELNIRLRRAGGVVWFDPKLAVEYRPRSTWRSLARQYFQYGQWKAEVLRRYPASLKLRQAAPPLVPVGLLFGLLAGWVDRRWWLLPAAYGAAVTALAPRRDRGLTAVVVAVMHVAWGAGFWWGAARPSPEAATGTA